MLKFTYKIISASFIIKVTKSLVSNKNGRVKNLIK